MILVPDRLWGILTLWAEARGEPVEGQVAVAEVIQRRTAQHFMSAGTVASTVLWPMQFSCWNTSDPNRKRFGDLNDEDPLTQEVMSSWDRAAAGLSFAPGALHYYNPSTVETPWAKTMLVVANIGRHRFLR